MSKPNTGNTQPDQQAELFDLCSKLEQLASLLGLLADQTMDERVSVRFESALALARDLASDSHCAFADLAESGALAIHRQPAEGGAA